MTMFEEIRPFRTEEEVKSAIQRILTNKEFYGFAQQMFPGKTLDEKYAELSSIATVDEFQTNIINKLLIKLIEQTSDGFTIEGIENLDKNKTYLFISNHRDIIMDSALLCHALKSNGFDTVEIAIGSNLLIHSWITDLVKINKSFVVKRGGGRLKEQLMNAKTLSAYIKDTITNRGESIWIAQREGRTKDGCDATQLSLLKMLNLAKDKDTKEHLSNLSIVPLSISYEYEPCDGLKTNELYQKTTPEGYQKTTQDDMMSMFIGLKQQKGRIQFTLGKPIDNEFFNALPADANDAEVIEELAKKIDAHIVGNYRLFPDNYIALDMLNETAEYKEFYTEEEKELFVKHMNKKLEKINGTTNLHRELFLKIYANPVLNKQKYEL